MWRSLFLGAALTFAAAGGAVADDVNYPTGIVRMISPFEAGGGNDAMARTLAQKFSELWKKNAIVEDKPGGNGNIGTDYVARAKADGHTLLVTTNATIVINPQLFKSTVRYDPVNDFAPVSLLAKQPFVLVVHPSLPIKSFAELVDYARSHPGKLNFASSGAGGGAHLSGEMLKTLLHLDMTHVPYKGAAPALLAVLAGQVDFMFVAILTARPYLENGELRALAVTSKTRNPSTPKLPAVAEYPGLEGFRGRSLVWPVGAGQDRSGDRQPDLPCDPSRAGRSRRQGPLRVVRHGAGRQLTGRVRRHHQGRRCQMGPCDRRIRYRQAAVMPNMPTLISIRFNIAETT